MMAWNSSFKLSVELMDLARVFLSPENSTHRQYEALRAYFVDRLSGPEVARRFAYTPGSFHQLVHQFRQQPRRPFLSSQRRRAPRSSTRSDNASCNCASKTCPFMISAKP